MSVQFFTEYPLWFIVFCLAAGAAYSWVLYRSSNNLFQEPDMRGKMVFMSVLRFLSVSLIAFLLLNPLLKYISNKIEKPIVVLAIDNSESILLHSDSSAYREKLGSLFEQLQRELGSEIVLQPYLFGDKPAIKKTPDFKDKLTDLSELFEEVSNVYSGQHTGAMVVVSDGICNKGLQPVYAAGKLKFPVFTVGLGDTVLKKDLKISNVRTNSIAYLNNIFPAVIDIESDKCQGSRYALGIYKGPEKIYETQFTGAAVHEFKSVQIDLEAEKPGVLHYTAVLTQLDGEVTWVNNRRDFFIEVIDSRQKVLIAARSPHPDLSALKQAVESNKNFQVSVDISGNPSLNTSEGADVVILHQLPAANHHIAFIEELKSKKIPVLFVIGRQTNLSLFGNLKTGLGYTPTAGGFNQATGLLNSGFNLFENTEAVKSNIPNFPPFSVPFGQFTLNNPSGVMIYQQIGSVNTQQPLVCFHDEAFNRYGFFTGEGFWRWRLLDFERNGNHEVTNDLLCKSIQYLAARSDRRKLRVYASENTYFENEPVRFNAEYYNQSYEMVNKAELKMTLTNEQGKKFNYTFSRTDNAYKLDLGVIPPGTYQYTVKVTSGGNNETASGSLHVKPVQIESTDTRANHGLLRQLSYTTGGKFLPLEQVGKLAEWIKKQTSVKPVLYEEKEFKDLIHQKWVFFVILILITAEWLIRKRNGAY